MNSRVVSLVTRLEYRRNQLGSLTRGRNFHDDLAEEDVEGQVRVGKRKNFGGQVFCRKEKSAAATSQSACQGHDKNPHQGTHNGKDSGPRI